MTQVARTREPGSSSKQQVQSHLESQENPKRRRRSDDEFTNQTNHSLDTITVKPTKGNTELTGEYTKPITMAITLSDINRKSGYLDPRTHRNAGHFDDLGFSLLPHVLSPKYERRQRPRSSQGFRIGKNRGNLAMTPDVGGCHLPE